MINSTILPSITIPSYYTIICTKRYIHPIHIQFMEYEAIGEIKSTSYPEVDGAGLLCGPSSCYSCLWAGLAAAVPLYQLHLGPLGSH